MSSSKESLEDLIPVVNKLQDIVFNTIGLETLDLPQVVVVGSQSSGKSSVLENIVGRDFLPRGTGIVTRRPLILQLVNVPPKDDKGEVNKEYGSFLHTAGHKFHDFDEIRAEIEKETARIAGTNKGINKLPIVLKIYSPKVLNITLVDLPGVTKVPIGDQPTDIEKQTKSLVLDYINNTNSLILAVTPANQDVANSDSLKMARSVDPESKRTIGVLTKLDLMDKGTNALDILNGNVYPLKLGFIGVVNRSQQDIEDSKSLDDSLSQERCFFRQHPAYRSIAHRCGTSYLAKLLNTTLMNHIRDRLPDIKARLNTLIGQTEQELAQYGHTQILSEDAQGPLILDMMTRFANSFLASIDGSSPDITTKEMCGGARIYQIFNNIFTKSLQELDPVANLSYSDVQTAIRNATGPRASLFVPEMAFDILIKPQIKLLEAPAQMCVELVYEELMKICHSCSHNNSQLVGLERFPKLQARLIEVVSQLLNERLGPTSSYVTSLIDIQRAYINTNHPNFMGAARAMAEVFEDDRKRNLSIGPKSVIEAVEEMSINNTAPPLPSTSAAPTPALNGIEGFPPAQKSNRSRQPPKIEQAPSSATGFGPNADATRDTFLNYFFGTTETVERGLKEDLDAPKAPTPMALLEAESQGLSQRELLECELIVKLIVSYFDIVRESICDQVPKAIMHLLVNYSKKSAQTRLVTELYKSDIFDDLLYEDENIVQERRKCQETLDTFKRAAVVITGVM